MLIGIFSLNAQPPYAVSDAAVISDKPDKPGPERPCATIDNVTQECQADGTVTISFYVTNNTAFNVDYFYVSVGGSIVAEFNNINFPPQTTFFAQVNYTGAVQGALVCFDVNLYSFSSGQGLCCKVRQCVRVIDCPCAEINELAIECDDNGEYTLCFEVTNPAYSTNTIDKILLFSDYTDLCVNGTPSPMVSIPPIAPGNTATVCVDLVGCNNPIPSGVSIDFSIFLEDTSDPAYCCHIFPDPVDTPNCCDEFTATATSTDSDCDVQNGTITFTMSGGTAPYSITYQTNSTGATINNVTQNPFTANFVAAGTYTYVITDANGCEATGQVTVNQVPCLCDNINDDTEGGQGAFMQTYTADGNGFLCFSFNTLGQPDMIQILVNGVEVANSGLYSTDFTTAQAQQFYPNCPGVVGGGGTPFSASVPVSAGDQITINITGSSCSGPGTLWELNVTCQGTPCGTVGPNNPVEIAAQLSNAQEGGNDTTYKNKSSQNRVGQTSTNDALKIFPNPVRDILTIKNTDMEVNYEGFRILDSSGRVIATENMGRGSEIRVDVSSYPLGIYFIEAIDDAGNKVTERFVKAN